MAHGVLPPLTAMVNAPLVVTLALICSAMKSPAVVAAPPGPSITQISWSIGAWFTMRLTSVLLLGVAAELAPHGGQHLAGELAQAA